MTWRVRFVDLPAQPLEQVQSDRLRRLSPTAAKLQYGDAGQNEHHSNVPRED
jgi:hypothetical protein